MIRSGGWSFCATHTFSNAGLSLRTGNAVGDQAVVTLELSERGFSSRPENRVSIDAQPDLDPPYQVAAVAAS
jgi:hypothetical protein